MRNYLLIFFMLFFVPNSFSQPVKDIAKTLVGTWNSLKMELTVDNKTTQEPIKDPSSYTFRADHTYTLSCSDIWGKATINGKWKQEGKKVKLFDITHTSSLKGPLPGKIPEYFIELRAINDKIVLIFSSYDEKLKWLHELYYEK